MARRTLAVVLAALWAVALLASPARASTFLTERYAFSVAESRTECGVAYDWTLDAHGVFQVRDARGSGGEAYLFHDAFEFLETFTNPANGRSFTISGRVNARELTATHLEGTIWAFTQKDSGATWVVRDANGTVLYRDAGTIEWATVWNLFGDGQPSGEMLSRDVTALHGHFTSTDWCGDLITPLLG